MMLAAGVARLVVRRPAANIEALNELHAREQIENSINARDPNSTPIHAQLVENLLGRQATVLCPEELHNGCARSARPKACAPECSQRVFCPGTSSGRRTHAS